MPRIQDYNRQVSVSGQGGSALKRSNAEAQTSLMVADTLQNTANDMLKYNAQIAKEQERQRKQDVHDQSLEIGNKINEEVLAFEKSEIARVGQDAYGTQERVDKFRQDIEGRYINPALDPDISKNVRNHVAVKSLQLKDSLSKHEAGQRKVVGEQVLIGSLNNSIKAAQLGTRPLEDIMAENDIAVMNSKTLSSEEMENKIISGQSAIAKSHLTSLMERNPSEAKTLLESGYYNRFLDGKTQEAIAPTVDKFLAYENGTTMGNEIFEKHLPQTMNDPIDVASMREEVRKSGLKDDAKLIAEKRVEERAKELNAARKEKVDVFTDNLWQRIDDGQLRETTALKAVDTADIPGTERVRLKKQVESYFKPPADPEAKMMQYFSQMEKLAELQEKINNGDLRVKSLKDGLKHVGDIGKSNVVKLVSYGSNYEKALATPALAPGQFDTVIDELRRSGAENMPKKGSAEYKAMQATILDEVVTVQTKTGKILDDEGLKKQIRKVVNTKLPVSMSTSFLGIPFYSSTEEKRLWEVQNPDAIDIKGMLKSRLKREPTQAEVQEAKEALSRKTTRRDAKTRAPFGGN